MPGKRPKRNYDPSRRRAAAAGSDGGTHVGGRDDREILPGYVGGADWRGAVARAGRERCIAGCSSDVRDCSAGRERRSPDTPGVNIPAATGPCRAPPCIRRRTGQRHPFRVSLRPSGVVLFPAYAGGVTPTGAPTVGAAGASFHFRLSCPPYSFPDDRTDRRLPAPMMLPRQHAQKTTFSDD